MTNPIVELLHDKAHMRKSSVSLLTSSAKQLLAIKSLVKARNDQSTLRIIKRTLVECADTAKSVAKYMKEFEQ